MMMMVTRLHGIGVRKGEKLAKRKRNNGFVLCTVDNHSENDVCIPCMNSRIEAELKAKLCYTNAKIYIKLLNEDREEPQNSNSINTVEECYSDSCKKKIINNYNCDNNLNEINANTNYNCQNGENDTLVDTSHTSCDKDVSSNTTIDTPSTSFISDANNNSENKENVDNEFNYKVNTGNVNGKSSPSHSSMCNNSNVNGMTLEPVAVRRSTRPRRGGKTVEIVVSSDLTLKDVKKKIYEKMEVVTLDQHLLTVEGVELSKDHMTLADLSILPGTMLHLKVDEPPRELSPEWQESTNSREVERGFSGSGVKVCAL
ncbi:hypothetical protein PGB90_006653 [Kerria lacca]